MNAAGRFLRRHWFVVTALIYGCASAAVGAGVLTGSYWIGTAFGLAAYIGRAIEDAP